MADVLELEEIGAAQVAFRNANETIQASADSFTFLGPIPFVCECPNRACADIVRLTFDEYEAIRQHPRRFFNITGHERPSVKAGAERIITVIQQLTIVEKLGVAGQIATKTYPRHT